MPQLSGLTSTSLVSEARGLHESSVLSHPIQEVRPGLAGMPNASREMLMPCGQLVLGHKWLNMTTASC